MTVTARKVHTVRDKVQIDQDLADEIDNFFRCGSADRLNFEQQHGVAWVAVIIADYST